MPVAPHVPLAFRGVMAAASPAFEGWGRLEVSGLEQLPSSGPVLLAVLMGMAGFLSGIAPSRDMLVRAAAPPGAVGRVFGIVTTGFNIGGTIGPILGGWIMDHGQPRLVFYASVCFMLITVVMALNSERRLKRRTLAPAE